MLAKTSKDGLIKIRVDMLSNRPHAMTNYALQGTKGCYESARSGLESDKIWLQDLCPDMNTWMRLEALEAEYLPAMWRHPPKAALQAGHGGGDYFEVMDFINSIVDNTPAYRYPRGDGHDAAWPYQPGLDRQWGRVDGCPGLKGVGLKFGVSLPHRRETPETNAPPSPPGSQLRVVASEETVLAVGRFSCHDECR